MNFLWGISGGIAIRISTGIPGKGTATLTAILAENV